MDAVRNKKMNLPQRTSSHILESKSINDAINCFPDDWIVRRLDIDYGLDLNVEIVEDNQVTGLNFSVQLKATSKKTSEDSVPIVLKKTTIHYMKQKLEPIMIIAYVDEEKESYWSWIRDFEIDLEKDQKSYTINIPKRNKLKQTEWPSLVRFLKNLFDIKINAASPESDTQRFGRYAIELNGRPRYNPSDIETLENLIINPETKEIELQKFLEKNPHMLLGGEYHKLHGQLRLDDSNRILIPDFFIQSVNGFCDILEIKRPTARLFIKQKNRSHHTAHVTSAIAQTYEYKRFFDAPINRTVFAEKYDLQVFNPRLILLAGRDSEFENILDKKMIEASYINFKLFTYDDLLSIAKLNYGI